MNTAILTKKRKLHSIRIMHGLSMRGLAEAAGLNPATVFNVESGRRNPSTQTAKKIYTALGLEFNDLFELED